MNKQGHRTHGYNRGLIGSQRFRNASKKSRITDLGYIKGGACDRRVNEMAAIEAGANTAIQLSDIDQRYGWCSIEALAPPRAAGMLPGLEQLGFYRCLSALRKQFLSGKKFRRKWLDGLSEHVSISNRTASDQHLYRTRKQRGEFLEGGE